MGAVSYDPVRERAESIVHRALARRTIVDELVSRVQTYGVPVVVVGYGILQLVRRLKSRKPKQTASTAPASSATKAAEKQAERQRKIRRDYKVRRSGEGDFGLMAGFHGDDFPTDIDPGDNVLEGYNEGEVEAAGEAGGEGGPPNQMLQMLQQMGFRVVMPKDGSGQVFLVPPGAEAPSEEEMSGPGGQIMTGGRFQISEGVPEGDEEGEDGDEDGGEGGRYLDDGEEGDEYDEDEEDGEEYEEA